MRKVEYIADTRPSESIEERLAYLNWKGQDGWMLLSTEARWYADDGRGKPRRAHDLLVFAREVPA